MNTKIIKDVLFRSIALFLVTALPAIGAGSFIGVEPINSAVIAGALAVSRLVLHISRVDVFAALDHMQKSRHVLLWRAGGEVPTKILIVVSIHQSLAIDRRHLPATLLPPK